jgi:hypothetical protein
MFTAGGGDALLVTAGGIGVRVNDLTAATTVKALTASLNVTGTSTLTGNSIIGVSGRERVYVVKPDQ